MLFCLLEVAQVILFLTERLQAQTDNSDSDDGLYQCECMEYWQCIVEGGAPYTYCAFSDEICCFLEPSSRKVGILPKRAKVTSCGQKGIDSGRDGSSEPGEWAWHAAILEKPLDLYVCGGSLVDELWVLTAAHCVDDYRNPRVLKIRLGEHDVSNSNEPQPHEEFDVAWTVLHPDFNNETLENDIALIRLRKRVQRRPHINNVCMPESSSSETEMMAASRCYITGWGRRSEGLNHSFVLKEVNVPIWRRERCEAALQLHFGTEYQLPYSSVCAGAEDRDACDGDGGGPLVCEKKSRWYQIGIISFGIGCGRRNIPGVYTRVHAYSSWIHSTIFGSGS